MKRIEAWISVLLAVSVLHSSGCTLIGYGAGRSVDRNSRVEIQRVECDAAALKEGRLVRLSLKDGSKLSGNLVGTRCGQEPALVIEIQRLNRSDTVDTVRVDAIESMEIQTEQITGTLVALGALTDIAVALVIAASYSGISGTMR